ncbi:MAG: carbamoyltransferase [Acidobacteriota bacterium]
MTTILGLSAFYHDSAACLVRDGEIVAAAQEERFSRKKHDHGFPRLAVQFCLREAGVRPDDLSLIAFYDKPWLKFERLLATYLSFAPAGLPSFVKSMPLWLKEKLWMDDLIKREVGGSAPVLYPAHHQSHAASAFFPSPFERAGILTIDGVGEWATASWGAGEGNRVEVRCEMNFPHSLGLLYSAFTYYTGFKVNSGEYKVMGLAPYGEPRYVDTILKELVDLKADGSLRLNMRYFNYCQGLTMTSKAFDELFGGPPRQPESALTQREMDLARSLQDVTEMAMLRMARHVRRETGERFLCMAGGVALNCVANGKILREGIFDDIWIQPAAGDAGGALGAALFAHHQVQGQPRRGTVGRDRQRGSYLGPMFDGTAIESWLRAERLPYRRHTPDEVPAVVARLLADQRIVGWFSGRMEFGPRALGARSIIGDARNPKMQSLMNLKIKFRESFRPFAPSCLLEDVDQYFELDRPSPYMLLVADVRSERRLPMTPEQGQLFGIERLSVPRSDIPAVTHVDYSARIQTVDSVDHPQYYRLIREFKSITGCGVIINTSFNVRGEPIVCTPQDAYLCFMRTGIDVLVLENHLLFKGEQPPLAGDEDWRSKYQLD